MREVDQLIARRGWQIDPTSPARTLLAETVSALHELGHDDLLVSLDRYAQAAEQIATLDLEPILRRPALDSMLEGVVIGTVFGDTLLAAPHRVAQEHTSSQAGPAEAGRGPSV